ncbi:MAG: AAA family ATPase [Anaerolineales bacterium]|nr:AAA family ATPase [Anaerolineales bacterium]MCX7754363.1 AAA family ATPase [Anaerolineales bacterium]MDW8277885.1 AAA family ATPase [Anaerolineales bacterium]
METFPYTRLVVIGVTGSGKSTLAERLARKLDLTFIELDALHWRPGWVEAPDDEFRALTDQATRAPRWVVAGNYHIVRDLVWPRAQAVLWLDYPFWTVFWRLTGRIFRRWWQRELIWGTNRETLWVHFKFWSDDSLWRWLLKTYWRRKREFPQLLALPEHRHLHVYRFETPEQTEKWFAALS